MATITGTQKIDLQQYYAMGEQGLLGDRRVELIDGEMIDQPMQGTPHAISLELVRATLSLLFGPQFWVRMQLPLDFAPFSCPEPDVAVVLGTPRSYVGQPHPSTALLAVEVSETTLNMDRHRKASLYAAAGIQDYWIVNLEDHQLEIYRDPIPDATADFGHSYATSVILQPGDLASPLAMPNRQVAVNNLLP